MEKAHLREILIDQTEAFLNRTGLIERDLALSSYLDTSQVVVITGIRRCGKSSLLSLIRMALGEFLSTITLVS